MTLIDGLFAEVLRRGGSDLHLAANQPPLVRVRGELVTLRESAMAPKELEEMLLELVTPVQRARLAADLDLDLSVEHDSVARFRGTYYVKHSGLAATFRVVPKQVPSLTELGCPEPLCRLATRQSGLVLVSGPSSNGKTTTAAAMIDYVNKTRACHIVTIESPIEFVHRPIFAQISQREVGVHIPDIVTALRSTSQDDADVVFVSELASAEEFEVALRLASDGALVVATFRSSSVVTTLERLVGVFEPEKQSRVRGFLADCLAGVVVQHIVRSADSKGRVVVHEILSSTPAVRTLVRENKLYDLPSAMKAGSAQGMQTLDAALERLLSAGKISPEVAFERSIDKEGFARLVARVKPGIVEASS